MLEGTGRALCQAGQIFLRFGGELGHDFWSFFVCVFLLSSICVRRVVRALSTQRLTTAQAAPEEARFRSATLTDITTILAIH